PSRGYLAELHVPLVAVLVILSVIIGAIGFALRPGTDAPPPVSDNGLALYVDQQRSATSVPEGPERVSVDETMMQEDSSTVLLQIDVFAAFARAGVARWELGTSVSGAQPYPCPDPYSYLGTAQPDPFVTRDGYLVIGSRRVTPTIVANFVGRRSTRTAANVLGLYGQSPGGTPAGRLAPVAEVDLCWTRNLPMAFDGEFASAALPAVTVPSQSSGTGPPVSLTRSLYFENKVQPHQPVTAKYSLQAGTLPTSTDPFGWHWSGSQQQGPVQVTAIDIPLSQHEAYLGFLSGVLFGVVGGAVVLILQELLEPIRLRRRTRDAARD
ncbi:MAG TPA: hypothetical protein VHY31_10390, partial [Streptosporangiaceae bacterium]|nr:hypothetical protein [Streptosporangiaceae bacterium]